MAANLDATTAPSVAVSARGSSVGGSNKATDGERPSLDFAAMVRAGLPVEDAAEAPRSRPPVSTMEASQQVQRADPAVAADDSREATGAGDSTAAPTAEREPGMEALLAEFADAEEMAASDVEPNADAHDHVDEHLDANVDAGAEDARASSAASTLVLVAPTVPAEIRTVTHSGSSAPPAPPRTSSITAAAASTGSADAAAHLSEPASMVMTPPSPREAIVANATPPVVTSTVATAATAAVATADVDTAPTLTLVPSVQAEVFADSGGLNDSRPLSGLLESMESPSTMLRLEAPVSAGRAPSLALPLALAGGPLPTMALAVDSGDGQWLQGMAQDIVQLQEAGETRLRINLAPAHLGSLQVELQQTDLGMELRVLADSASARDLLQAHGADLRQRFAEAGMHLAQFHCGTGSQSQNSGHSGSTAVHGASTGDGAGDDIPTPPVMRPLAALRLLDLYA